MLFRSGFAIKNKDNTIKSFWGINNRLGFFGLDYFEPLQANKWNHYFEFGTSLLILPYIGIDSQYSVNEAFIIDLQLLSLTNSEGLFSTVSGKFSLGVNFSL